MWNKLPQSLILRDNDVHIWIINIENYRENINNFQKILSRDEQEKVKKFSFDKLKERFIINRGYLRTILGQYLKIKPEEICFTYNQKGKPLLDKKIIPKIEFNLSHTNNYAVYAISKNNIGIDLEKIDAKVEVENIAKRFFCDNESNYLSNLPSMQKPEYFFKLWTIKEAYLKAIGEGLSGGLDSICFAINKNNQQIELFTQRKDQKVNNNWHFKTWILVDDHIMSIAINSLIEPKFYYYSDLGIINYS
jgi:4'-phosphopantetheinyl transferase